MVTNNPHPIGYVEYQRAWVADGSPERVNAACADIAEQVLRENPHLTWYSTRLEHTLDGAGVKHFNFYMGFAPPNPTTEPLDPRNLNKSDHYDQIGDPARDHNIGAKEQKF